MFNNCSLKKSLNKIFKKEIVLFFISLFLLAKGSHMFKLDCNQDYKECALISDMGAELKVQNLKCIDDECKDTFLIADDDKWYVCEHGNKRSGKCAKIFNTNTLQLQSALLDLLIENAGVMNAAENYLEKNTAISEIKRALPFETLNYGRRKRHLPFETLNYGKRASASQDGCDCSGMVGSANKRALPFETMLYGKRALPFETLNYGKRAYIPIDGYIMGKRVRNEKQY